MIVVIASYRQNVHAYPSGGGDYEVATVNLGPNAGVVVASALLVDYTLTVAVSVSAGVDNLGSAVPFVVDHKVAVALAMVALLTLVNLRGVRESGLAFAIPSYAFMLGVLTLVAVGLFRILVLDDDLKAPTAELRDRARGRRPGRARAGVPRPARVLLGLRSADRRGGDQQRRPGVPEAEEQERGDHPGADGRRSP